MGNMIVCDRVCLGVAWTSSLWSCDGQSSLADDTGGQGLCDKCIPLGGSAFQQIGQFRDSLSLNKLFFQFRWLKIISVPNVLRWHVLNSYSHISAWHSLLPFNDHCCVILQSSLSVWVMKITFSCVVPMRLNTGGTGCMVCHTFLYMFM